jgi:hypothetical protein
LQETVTGGEETLLLFTKSGTQCTGTVVHI